MSGSLGLQHLFTALRESGLPVGVTEVARLRQVFALGPQREEDTDGRRLKAVLRAVLVKSAEDRVVFDGVFNAWMSRAGPDLDLRSEPRGEVQRGETPKLNRPIRRNTSLVISAVIFGVLTLVFGLVLVGYSAYIEFKKVLVPPSPEAAPSAEPFLASQTAALTPAAIRERRFTTWVPTLTVMPGKPVWQGWPPLMLGVLAFATAAGLWFSLRRRPWLPPPAPEPVKKGPPRIFLTPPLSVGPELLAPREEEALIWGIGHFVAEEPTRRLDLATTVRATARAGGIPQLHFQQARYQREVWLWVDEAAADADPAIQRLAGEVEMALHAHRLPIERSLFRGVPDLLVSASGQAFAPNEVDERRDAALVAILTDGRILARQYGADDRRVRLDVLLRGLSHWPRLAFVDYAAEPGELAGILAKHAISRITPMELAAFLGSDEALRRRAVTLGDGDVAWAAACALAPSPVAEFQAFELRRCLGLATSPWALRTLRAEAPGPAVRLQWRSPDRARRVNWLRNSEDQNEHGIAAGSLFDRALSFWEEAYDWELKRLSAEAPEETPARQHLSMERALLGLWREGGVAAAVRELYRLHGGALREPIERHLRDLAPLGWGKPEHARLAWKWEVRSDAEQVMLLEMKLGGGMPAAKLQRPGRLLAGIGVCFGLAAGALSTTALSETRPSGGPPIIVHGPGKPADATEFVTLTRPEKQRWYVRVETHKWGVAQEVRGDGRQVNVLWRQVKLPCVQVVDDAELWRCGTLSAPTRLNEAEGLRMIGLATEPGTPGVDALAVDLLDSGSADVVAIGRDWRSLNAAALSTSQMLLVPPSSPWEKLAKALRFEGTRTVAQVWPNLQPLAGDPNALLRGLNEMIFVHLPAGTFTMGSDARDPRAYPDEMPAHQVTLSEYWIGKYEVTEAQYHGQGTGNRPATSVQWDDADAFCKRNGWRLPTEAEWEYAARAGAQKAWSFGDNEKALDEYAWHDENSSFELHPVGTKKSNSWGIHDMYGNAWEWVADWYGPYEGQAQMDPNGPTIGDTRVLRGGAFDSAPRNLRSSVRLKFRVRHIGFRCAHDASPPSPLSHPAGRGTLPLNR